MALKITKEEENIMPQEETVKEMSFDVSDVDKMNIKIDKVDAPVESVTTVENIEHEEEEQNDVNSSHYSEESVNLEEDLTYEESPRNQMSLHEEKAKKGYYLYQLRTLNRDNRYEMKEMSMRNSLEDIENEYFRLKENILMETGKETVKRIFNTFSYGLEAVLIRQKIMKLNVKNLHYKLVMDSNTPEYEKYFMDIYDRYFSSITDINPLLALAFAVTMSVADYHLSNTDEMQEVKRRYAPDNPYGFEDEEDEPDIADIMNKIKSNEEEEELEIPNSDNEEEEEYTDEETEEDD